MPHLMILHRKGVLNERRPPSFSAHGPCIFLCYQRDTISCQRIICSRESSAYMVKAIRHIYILISTICNSNFLKVCPGLGTDITTTLNRTTPVVNTDRSPHDAFHLPHLILQGKLDINTEESFLWTP